jgi:hypothetical protein
LGADAEVTLARTGPDPGGTNGLDADEPAALRTAGPSTNRPRMGGRRGWGIRSSSLAAVALGLLAVIVAVGGGLGEPAPSASLRAADSSCAPVDPARGVPAFRLAPVGDDAGSRGLPGAVHGAGVEATFGDWPVPDLEQSVDVTAREPLHLVLATGACLTAVHVEAWDASLDHVPAESNRQLVIDSRVSPGDDVEIPGLSSGDWALRVVAEYWTGSGGPAVATEWFFRVRVAEGSLASPTASIRPLIAPAVSCGPTPASSADVVITMAAPSVAPVAGLPFGADSPTVDVGLGDAVEIAVEGDACATSWTIERRTDAGIVPLDGVPNVDNDPRRAAQNRWRFTLPAGESVVIATMRFGPSVIAERAWLVRVAAFSIPAAFLLAPDDRRVAAVAGCDLSLELANGYTAADSCGSLGYDGSGDSLVVAALQPIVFEIPGWTIVAWSGECGQIVAEADGTTTFVSGGCDLGGFDAGGASFPPDVRFVLRPGEHVVRLQVSATRNGDLINVPFYAMVTAE